MKCNVSHTFSDVFFTLTHVHVDELWTFDTETGNHGQVRKQQRSQSFSGERPECCEISHLLTLFMFLMFLKTQTHLRKVMEHSVATALANRVFPVPGGPYNRTPVRFRHKDKSSGRCRGSWIVSRISFFTVSKPPTSSQRTVGICQHR